MVACASFRDPFLSPLSNVPSLPPSPLLRIFKFSVSLSLDVSLVPKWAKANQ